MWKISLLSFILITLPACKSTIKQELTPEEQVYSKYENKQKEAFSKIKIRKSEIFRLFVSSSRYEIEQVREKEKIQLKEDESANQETQAILQKTFDKINYTARAIISIELYPDSGSISRIRFTRPTGIQELDKVVSEDASRLIFEFPNKVIDPIRFEIHYMIVLKKRINRKEAFKLLKKHVN